DGLGDPLGVLGPPRRRPVPLGRRGDRAGLAAASLEAADPAGADAVPGGDRPGPQAGVAVGEDALAQVEGVGVHGDSLDGRIARDSYEIPSPDARPTREPD